MQSRATDGDAERIRALDEAWAAAAGRGTTLVSLHGGRVEAGAGAGGQVCGSLEQPGWGLASRPQYFKHRPSDAVNAGHDPGR